MLAAATASPKTLLGQTAAQLTQPVSVSAGKNVRSSVSPQQGNVSDANPPNGSPRAWATTIRSSPEFAKRMNDLVVAHTDHHLQQQDNQRVLAGAPAELSTTVELRTTVADLRATMMGLEDESAALKDELEEVRRQGKEDLALAVRALLTTNCWFVLDCVPVCVHNGFVSGRCVVHVMCM